MDTGFGREPPATIARRPRAVMSSIARRASSTNRAAEYRSCGSRNATR
jgi:hypothetical protein